MIRPETGKKSEVGENENGCGKTDHVEYSNEGEIDLERKNLAETNPQLILKHLMLAKRLMTCYQQLPS